MIEENTLARLKASLAVARKCRKKAKHTRDLACYNFHDGEAHGLNAAIYAIQNGGSEPVTLPTPSESTLASATGWASEVSAMAKRLLEIEEAIARQNVGTHIWTNIHIGRLHLQDAVQSLGKMPNA